MLQLRVASSNEGKVHEYRALAADCADGYELSLIPNFSTLPVFAETAGTFGENAAGKALHYSRFAGGLVMADDSGLVVPALGGAPGVYSARYAGPSASDSDRINKLVREMRGKRGQDRAARFVCVAALARAGEILAIFSDAAEGLLLDEPQGAGGFGYDPIFYSTAAGKTFAELTRAEKNLHSHRGKAFRKLLELLMSGYGA